MKKSFRKPSRSVLDKVQGEQRIVKRVSVLKDAQTSQTITKKVEGKDMLFRVRKYDPVAIKGNRYTF